MATKKKPVVVSIPDEAVEMIPDAPRNLPWVGIQKMLKKDYGYQGQVDGLAGILTIAAIQKMLIRKYEWKGVISGRASNYYWAGVQGWLNSEFDAGIQVTGIEDAATADALRLANDALI